MSGSKKSKLGVRSSKASNNKEQNTKPEDVVENTSQKEGESVALNGDSETKKQGKIRFLSIRKFNNYCMGLVLACTFFMIVAQVSFIPNPVLVGFSGLFAVTIVLALLAPIVKLLLVKPEPLK